MYPSASIGMNTVYTNDVQPKLVSTGSDSYYHLGLTWQLQLKRITTKGDHSWHRLLVLIICYIRFFEASKYVIKEGMANYIIDEKHFTFSKTPY